MGTTYRSIRKYLLCLFEDMRFGRNRKHDMYENIKRNGQVVVSLVAPPDIALSIRGKARVAKEPWNL